MTIDEWLEKRKKDRRNVRTVMNTFLRGLATFHNNNGAKLRTIIKYRDQLGPEWCLKVTSSLDDIIEELQRLRTALEDDEGIPHGVSRAMLPGAENGQQKED